MKSFVLIFYSIGIFASWFIIHDYILRLIYCHIKQKRKNKNKCYYWTCSKFKDCEFNDKK